MTVWKLQRLGQTSAATGEPFPPDTEIVTALFGEDEEVGEDRVRGTGFVRRDYLPEEATEERLAGAWCVWRTRTPAARPERERRFDLALARDFLQRMLDEGREDRAPVCLTLALLLARKRRLVILEQDAQSLGARWPNEKETFRVPAPAVTEADAEALQQDLMRLFGFDVPGEEPGGGDAEAPPAGEPGAEPAGDSGGEAGPQEGGGTDVAPPA
jgi:hypothetical protein